MDTISPSSIFRPCFALVLSIGLMVAGCSSSEPEDGAKDKNKVVTIEKIEGMRYYVGGPILKYDQYGRLRLGGFNGEVSTPSTRGLLIGFKKNDDNTFDFGSWLNGEPFARSTGRVDDAGLLWYDERRSYDGNGNVTMRQTFVYDDEDQMIRTTLEQVDPEDGEVIKTTTQDMPYAPAEGEDSEDDVEIEIDVPVE